MGLFEQLRKDRQDSALPGSGEPQPVPEFERESAEFAPCRTCRPACPIAWQDPYGAFHCASCDYPPTVSMVKRVLVLVGTSLPSHHLAVPQEDEEFDQVERPDMHARWARLERERNREKHTEGDDEY